MSGRLVQHHIRIHRALDDGLLDIQALAVLDGDFVWVVLQEREFRLPFPGYGVHLFAGLPLGPQEADLIGAPRAQSRHIKMKPLCRPR